MVPVPSYRLGEQRHTPVIECLLCGAISAHPRDISERYCGRCHQFHDAVAAARTLHAEGATHECHEWRTGRDVCALCGRRLTDKKKRGTRVNSGQYFLRTPGEPLEPTGPGIPDVVICRRVVDFPGAQVPPGGTRTVCRDCDAPIVTNRAKYPDRPRICMQCASIEPLPIE